MSLWSQDHHLEAQTPRRELEKPICFVLFTQAVASLSAGAMEIDAASLGAGDGAAMSPLEPTNITKRGSPSTPTLSSGP